MGTNFLICRTDSIGDVILTLPVAGVLKQLFPDAHITFLGNAYTLPVIRSCKHVDTVLDWDTLKLMDITSAKQLFSQLNIHTCIHVFPTKEVTAFIKRMDVPIRIASTGRFFNYFTCNRLVPLSRKRSNLHEAQLNLKLLKGLGAKDIYGLDEIPILYGFEKIDTMQEEINNLIDTTRCNIVLHPSSKGSSKEWPLENYIQLITLLPSDNYKIFVSGTIADAEKMKSSGILDLPDVTDITGKMTLASFIAFLSQSDGLVSASTGPLHIAAALGKRAIGLYPDIRPIHAGRWAPIGVNASVIIDETSNQLREGYLNIPVEKVLNALTNCIKH